jgi:hypothetical protein
MNYTNPPIESGAGPQPFYIPPTPVPQGFAITSLVLGCVGILTFWIYGIVSILAIVFGGISISQSRKAGRKPQGMAVAGLVLGIVELAILALIVLAAVATS